MNAPAFRHRFTIGLHDTDAAGVMFFAHLFRHAHEAYERFMTAAGFPLAVMIAERRLGLPVVHAEADYRAPLRHGEAIEVALTVSEVGEKSFRIRYRFGDDDGTARAEVETVHAAIDPAGGSAVPIPEALRAALRGTTS